ncbi:type IV pilus modification PilV family protein [Dysosmobacter sp.]|uniref:type IV pilus modification PilV family protein n=1 Tax=Dysosmobacter sp. TaxID=2591382 RepID=UPI003AEFA5A6
MNKLRNNRGETLVESLVSILIAVLAFGILATSVVTAEKINAKTRNTNVMFRYDRATKQDPDKEIKLKGADKSGSGPVSLYENNGYYYYSHDKAGAGS